LIVLGAETTHGLGLMETVTASPYLIAVLFFIVAFVYSTVGLAGGSSYTALMAIFGFSTLAIPMISLALNLFVSTVGSLNFIRGRHAKAGLILPFLVSSIPMAYLGGSLRLPTKMFYWILLISMILVAIRIYAWPSTKTGRSINRTPRIVISLAAGSVLGLVAGIVGIGGGVYLVPLIIALGLGTEKQAAACGAIFIWLNSLSGILSRFQHNPIDLTEYIPLIVAALAGGALGSFMGSHRFSPKVMERILGVIILTAIAFLIREVAVL